MKKFTLILILLLGLFSVPKTNAISYRGFVEANGGVVSHNKEYVMVVGGKTTHGIQLDKGFFIGFGAGYEHVFNSLLYQNNYYKLKGGDSMNIFDFYGDFRWDGFGVFGTGKRLSPFVDIKIGYQLTFNMQSIIQSEGPSNYSIANHCEIKPSPGFFIKPSIGIRIGFSKKVGFNIGIYYDLVNFINLKSNNVIYYNNESNKWVRDSDFKKIFSYHPFGISLGIDF